MRLGPRCVCVLSSTSRYRPIRKPAAHLFLLLFFFLLLLDSPRPVQFDFGWFTISNIFFWQLDGSDQRRFCPYNQLAAAEYIDPDRWTDKFGCSPEGSAADWSASDNNLMTEFYISSFLQIRLLQRPAARRHRHVIDAEKSITGRKVQG